MGTTALRGRPTLESTAGSDSTLWRSEIADADGRMVDCTRWTANPRQAIRDGVLLELDRYWCSDARAPYTSAA